MTATPRAHAGQDRLYHRDRTKDVGCELTLEVVDGGFLHDTLMTISGIIHQYVDWSRLMLGGGYGRRERIEIGYVQHEWVGSIRRERGKGAGVAIPSHGPYYTVTGVKCADGKCPSQARTDTGDEESLERSCHRLNSEL